MALSSPPITLDPVTGLPLLGGDTTIDQIPLGQQVVPLDDLDASGRMARQPLYPDDVIPTTSMVVGNRRQVPRAISASLVTDPEDSTKIVPALNVNIAGQGSATGGGSSTPLTFVSGDQGDTNTTLVDAQPFFTPTKGVYAACCVFQGTINPSVYNTWTVRFELAATPDVGPLIQIELAKGVPVFAVVSSTLAIGSLTVFCSYNGYIDLASLAPGAQWQASIICSSSFINKNGEIFIWYH